mgnify:CR=1 FL=1
MGPRRERRGNLLVTKQGQAYEDALQWGRVVKDAEMRIARLPYEWREELQWGRVVKDAEMKRLLVMMDLRMKASMGPRRERRGNVTHS